MSVLCLHRRVRPITGIARDLESKLRFLKAIRGEEGYFYVTLNTSEEVGMNAREVSNSKRGGAVRIEAAGTLVGISSGWCRSEVHR